MGRKCYIFIIPNAQESVKSYLSCQKKYVNLKKKHFLLIISNMSLAYFLLDIGKIMSQFIFDILYFPLWWYTSGLLKTLRWGKSFLSIRLRVSGLGVWVKNIFTPMYGQTDWAGMIISFIVRVIQIIVRSSIMIFWIIFTIMTIALWLILPLIIFYQIIFQLDLIQSI